MRLVDTSSLVVGSLLEKPVISEDGIVLVREMVPLTKQMIERLKYFKIKKVYISDNIGNGEFSPYIKHEIICEIESYFKQMVDENQELNTNLVEQASLELRPLVKNILKKMGNKNSLIPLLSNTVAYDSYVYAHSFNVSLYSLAIGIELKLPPDELETLIVGGLLHDIGKLEIPLSILLKPSSLTKEEFQIIQSHTVCGYETLKKINGFDIIARIAYEHHECINGTGYPRGVTGKDMHLYSKIVAVADIFDALTTTRSYHSAYLPHHALEILYTLSGIKLDHVCVEAFRKAIILYPNGILVTLNDNRKGYVKAQNLGVSERPIVRINEVNNQLVPPYDIDLSTSLTDMIIEVEGG